MVSGVFLVCLATGAVAQAPVESERAAAEERVKAAESAVLYANATLKNAEAQVTEAKTAAESRKKDLDRQKDRLKAATIDLAKLQRLANPDPNKLRNAKAYAEASQSRLNELSKLRLAAVEDTESLGPIVSAARNEKRRADEALAKALADRQDLSTRIAEDNKGNEPPYLAEVRAFDPQNRLRYEGTWIPKRDELARRIAALKVVIDELPAQRVAAEKHLSDLIDAALVALKKADESSNNYLDAVIAEDAGQKGLQGADMAQNIIRDTASAGLAGFVVAGLVEARNFSQFRADHSNYWLNETQRLPALAESNALRVDTADELIELGKERQLTRLMEERMAVARNRDEVAARQQATSEQRTGRVEDDQRTQALLQRTRTDVENIVWTGTSSLDAVAVAVVTTLGKRLAVTLAEGFQEAPDQHKMERILRNYFKFSAADEAKSWRNHLSAVNNNPTVGLILDGAAALGKTWALQHLRKARLEAYLQYVKDWADQVWHENAVINASRDVLLIRQMRVAAITERDGLIRLRATKTEHDRAPEFVMGNPLSGPGSYRLELTFSKPVIVDSVDVGGKAVNDGITSKETWTGFFDLDSLPRHSEIRVAAHEADSRHELYSPYRIPIWDPAKMAWDPYVTGPDSRHVVSIAPSEKGTTIAIVLDTSGSMKDDGKLDKAIRLVRNIAGENDASTTQIGLFTYSDCEVTTAAPFSYDRKVLNSALANMSAAGDTPLSDSIRIATDALLANTRKTDVRLVVVSDGMDSCTKRGLSAALSYARTKLGTPRVSQRLVR
jgi:hypothetical protein